MKCWMPQYWWIWWHHCEFLKPLYLQRCLLIISFWLGWWGISPISVPNDFPIKTNQQANVETGGAKPRRHWERVENEIGLESGKKVELDSNLANWLKEVGGSHPPTCQTVNSFTVSAAQNRFLHNTDIIRWWNCVFMQDKRRHCQAWQCGYKQVHRQSVRGRRLSDVENSRIVRQRQCQTKRLK